MTATITKCKSDFSVTKAFLGSSSINRVSPGQRQEISEVWRSVFIPCYISALMAKRTFSCGL